MKKTFDGIDLNTDNNTDYSSIDAQDENRKAINECEKDDFLPELIKISHSLPSGNLKNKYISFIKELQKSYMDWSDCIITSYDELEYTWGDAFRNNNYDEYYFGDDMYESDVIHDYFIEDGRFLFINPDAFPSKKDSFVNKDGKEYKNPYFRYTPIDDFIELDSRLMVVYADYFILRYGFAQWLKSLSDDQFGYVSRNADKIKLTKNQKAMVTGNFDTESYMTSEQKVEKAYEIENSDDLAMFDCGRKTYPCAGFLMDRMPLSFVDMKKLSKKTFYYVVEHSWEKLGWGEKRDSSRRILVDFLLDDENFTGEKLARIYLPHHIMQENGSLWSIEEMAEFVPKNKEDEEKSRKRLKIIEDFIYFKKWFEEKEVHKYRYSANNRRSTNWNLSEAYKTVENPRDPQLYIDGFSPNYARVA